MNQFQFNLETLFKIQVTNNEPQVQFVNERYVYFNEFKNLKRLDLIDFSIDIIFELIIPIQCYLVNHNYGLVYIGHNNGSFSIIDIRKKKIISSFKIFDIGINVFDINFQYQVAIFGNTEGVLASVKIQQGHIVNKIDSEQKKITQIKVLRNMVLTAGLQSIVCRDLYLNQKIWEIQRHNNFITKLLLDEQNKQILSGQFHGQLLVTSIENQESVQLNTQDSFEFCKMDQNFLIVSELNVLTIWDLKTLQKIQSIQIDNFINRIVYCQKTDLIIVIKSNYTLEVYQIQRILDSQSESYVSNNQSLFIKSQQQISVNDHKNNNQNCDIKEHDQILQKYKELEQRYQEQQKQLENLKKYEFLEQLESFKGIILNGEKYGVCKETYKDGSKFLGNYQRNLKSGPGELRIGQKIIQGNFINNYIRGDIVIEDQESNSITTGTCDIFKDLDSPIKINSIQQNGITKEIIEGKFQDEKLYGYCNITFQNGWQIIGNFQNDILIIDQQAILINTLKNKKQIITNYEKNTLQTQQQKYGIDWKEGNIILLDQLINLFNQKCNNIQNQLIQNLSNSIDILGDMFMSFLSEKLIKQHIKQLYNLITIQECQRIQLHQLLQQFYQYIHLVFQKVKRKNVLVTYSFLLYHILKKASQPLVIYYINNNFKTPVEDIANWKYCRQDSKKMINKMLNRVVQLNQQLYKAQPKSFLDNIYQFKNLQLQLPKKKDLELDIHQNHYNNHKGFSLQIVDYLKAIYNRDIKSLNPSTEKYDFLLYALVFLAPVKYFRVQYFKKVFL